MRGGKRVARATEGGTGERQWHVQDEDLGENFLVHDDQDEQYENDNNGPSYETLFVHPRI